MALIKYNYIYNKRAYESWRKMRQRCFNKKNKDYHNYGGRGVTVCSRWLIFENFFEDMGDRKKGEGLDRINNNGNYEPSNCRWANALVQNNNKRNNTSIFYQGVKKNLTQWIKYFNFKPSTIRQRYYVYDWPVSKCFNYLEMKGEY